MLFLQLIQNYVNILGNVFFMDEAWFESKWVC